MRIIHLLLTAILLAPIVTTAQTSQTSSTKAKSAKLSGISKFSAIVKTKDGLVEGTIERSTIRSFKGIPFAAPPIGESRWKEPQPVKKWVGIKKTTQFGNNAMQKKPFGDMGFRSSGMSEDCLYLNVWSPENKLKEKLPVLVYFYGGGYVAGDGSEPRYDGEKMALKGVVTLTVNYRLGVFGFMAHPELTKESTHHSSGNYGLMDQNAALKWVQANIAAFGGDPKRVTIAGESAGSISVSAQMASPLSKNLIAGAIGESGAMINPTLAPISLEQGEKNGVALSQKLNANTLADLRKISSLDLLEETTKQGSFRTAATIDGYFLPKSVTAIFEAGEQANVPLLAGWNSAEVPYQALLGPDTPTVENYQKKLDQLYTGQAADVLKLYPATTQQQVVKAATELASDRFISYSTWKWLDLHLKTANKPVYRYLFSKSKPKLKADTNLSKTNDLATGAPHAFEIEYAMGNLHSNPTYAWTADDERISGQMLQYFANFVKNGNPNGRGLPEWPEMKKGTSIKYLNLDINTKQEEAKDDARYRFLDSIYLKH